MVTVGWAISFPGASAPASLRGRMIGRGSSAMFLSPIIVPPVVAAWGADVSFRVAGLSLFVMAGGLFLSRKRGNASVAEPPLPVSETPQSRGENGDGNVKEPPPSAGEYDARPACQQGCCHVPLSGCFFVCQTPSRHANIDRHMTNRNADRKEHMASAVCIMLAAAVLSLSTFDANAGEKATSAASSPIRVVPQIGHTATIKSIEYSRDGRFILTGSADGTGRLWDARSHILLRVFEALKLDTFQQKVEVWQASFIDHNRVVLLDNEENLQVFDMTTGDCLKTLPTKATYARATGKRMVALADGRLLLVSNTNARILSLDGQSTMVAWNDCTDSEDDAPPIHLSPQERYVATVSHTGRVQVRDLARLCVVATHDKPGAQTLQSAVLPGGSKAVLVTTGASSGGKERMLHVFDVQSNRIVASHKLPKGVMEFAVSPDNKTIAVRHYDGTLALRDLGSFELLRHTSLDESYGYRANICFSPDGKRLLAPLGGSTVVIFDIPRLTIVAKLSSENRWGMQRLALRPNRWQVAGASGDGKLYLFDVPSASLSRTFDAHVQYITSMDYSADGRFIVANELTNPPNGGGAIISSRIWDAITGREIWRTVHKRSSVRAARFSRDGKRLILGDHRRLVVKETKRWKTISRIAYDSTPTSISFSRDNRRIAIGNDSRADGFFNVRTGKRDAKFPMERVMHARFLPDGKRVLLSGFPGGVELWDISQNRMIRKYDGFRWTQERDMTAAELSADGKRFVGLAKSGTLNVWDVETGEVLYELPIRHGALLQAMFLPDPDFIAAADRSGALRVWNVKTRAMISFVADRGEWVVYTNDGYFDGSRRGGQLVAAVKGLSGYRIDQMANRNNRPDIILERMGLGSADIIAHYRRLYERRLKKMGLREADLNDAIAGAPTVAITASSRSGREATIEFQVESDDGLKSYNIYVNDVPVFGAAGKAMPRQSRTVRETVTLSAGHNEIEVGVLNFRGLESLRPSISMSVDETPREELYVLAFGVSRYANSELDLKFAAKDATDLAALLGGQTATFAEVHTKIYTNEEVTVTSVQEAKAFLATADVDDTVVLFAAGHGLYSDATRDYYYLTHRTDLNRIAETAVPFEQLEDLLQGIAPRKKLFLLDTCYSGEKGEDTGTMAAAAAGVRGLASRGIRRKILDGAGVPRGQHLYAQQRNRFIYNDLFRRSGAIVLSSSRGSELSYEKDELENGLFTEYVLRALSSKGADTDNDGRVSTDELRDYVSKSVSTASGGLQNPVVDRDNIEARFSLPIRGASPKQR